MSLLDFFVLEEAWSKRLRDFVKRVQSFNAKSAAATAAAEQRLDDLEADMGFLALLLMGTLKMLSAKSLLRDGELIPHLAAIDMLDGVEDGSLDLDAVRRLIGLPRAKKPPLAEQSPEVGNAAAGAARKAAAARPAAGRARGAKAGKAARPAAKPAGSTKKPAKHARRKGKGGR
jgi:hypothetical protein